MTAFAPHPQQPPPQRYSTRPFPAYRFIPGRFPHPRRHPDGHSYATPEPAVATFAMSAWVLSEDYLYGVDLFNYAYWWECHEQWEAIWKHVGSESVEKRLLQGLVQIAAACLRKFMGSHDSGAALARKGIGRLREFEDDILLGIDVAEFIGTSEKYFSDSVDRPPTITLQFPACEFELKPIQ